MDNGLGGAKVIPVSAQQFQAWTLESDTLGYEYQFCDILTG